MIILHNDRDWGTGIVIPDRYKVVPESGKGKGKGKSSECAGQKSGRKENEQKSPRQVNGTNDQTQVRMLRPRISGWKRMKQEDATETGKLTEATKKLRS